MSNIKSRIFGNGFTLLLTAAALLIPHTIAVIAQAGKPYEFKSTSIIAARNNVRAISGISDDNLHAIATRVGAGSPSFSEDRPKAIAQLLVSREVIYVLLNRYKEKNNGKAEYDLSSLRKQIKIWIDPETDYLHISLIAKSAKDAHFLLQNLLTSLEAIQRARRFNYSEAMKAALAGAENTTELSILEGQLHEDVLVAEHLLAGPLTKEFTVIDPANIPSGPFSPNVRNINIASALLSMVLLFLIIRYKKNPNIFSEIKQ
jgi:hypothetical protein